MTPKGVPNYDLMLLRVKGRIKYNKYVRPICVDRTQFPPGTRCMIAGWGSTLTPFGMCSPNNGDGCGYGQG